MSPARIIHLSDLHATGDAGDSERVVSALLTDIGRAHEERSVDLLVVSGDLTSSGQSAEFDWAKKHFLAPLDDLLGLDHSRVIVVPGNHDVNRQLIDEYYELGLRTKLDGRTAANDLLASPDDLSNAVRRLEDWQKFEREFYKSTDTDRIGPLGRLHRLELGKESVGIAALNSAWRSASDEDEGKLILGDRQVRTALKALEPFDLRLVVFHHPLEWLADWDADEVRGLLARAGSVVLTGHDHLADPTFETTVRGPILYSRAGCLYDSVEYRNGYSVIDIDAPRRATRVTLRTWYPDRDEFDESTEMPHAGILDVEWPPRPSTAVSVRPDIPFSLVMSTLGEIVQQRSIIADHLPENGASMSRGVDDVLVAPRLWPIPYREAMLAASLEDAPSPEALGSRELVETLETVILNGDPDSGVTGSLLWLLARKFEASDTHLPVYVPFDPKFKDTRFDRMLRREVGSYGLHVDAGDKLPSLIVAVDDVSPAHAGALNAFAKYVSEHPEHIFVLGCHGDSYESLHEALQSVETPVKVAHLGPFGRRELRTFVEKLTGGQSKELVNKVMRIIGSERLPRNPFIITALVTVIVRNIELADVNESSLLDAYVSFLLGQGEAYDKRGLEMDHRRREHLLAMFAAHLAQEQRSSLPRLAVEEFAANYFRARDWTERLSPGKVVEDLIARRILYENREGNVGFRHPAFRSLFAGKAILDDFDFFELLLAEPLANEASIRHAAGLRRSDPILLRRVREVTRDAIAAPTEGANVSQFDLIQDKPGWSKEDPDLESLRQRLELALPEPEEEEVDEQVDAHYDQLDFGETQETDSHPIDTAWQAAMLLARVLRNSELIDDVELKTGVLKDVLHDWSLFTVMMAVREDQEGLMRDRMREAAEAFTGGEIDTDAIARVIDIILVFVSIISLQSTLGTIHLERTVARALDDDAFMSETAHALLCTLLYAGIGAPDWPEKLRVLYQRHSGHPVVAEITRTYALLLYRSRGLTKEEEAGVEELLCDIYAPEPPPSARGFARNLSRGQARSRVLSELRKSRLGDSRKQLSSPTLEGALDRSDEDDGDDEPEESEA